MKKTVLLIIPLLFLFLSCEDEPEPVPIKNSDSECGGSDCLQCYAGEACADNDDCFSEICQNGVCEPKISNNTLWVGNSIPYTVHETFGFPQATKNAHENAYSMFADEFYRVEPVVLFYVNGYDTTVGDAEPTEPIPGTNQKSYEEVAQQWCDYTLCDDVSAVEQSFRDGGKNDGGWGVTCLLYTSPSPRDGLLSRMPSSA